MTEMRPVKDIKVGRRFRKDSGDIDLLVDSIRTKGLIQPIVIDRDNHLRAGYRRLKACKKLGLVEVPVTISESDDALGVELDENTVRKDFVFSERMALLEKIEERKRSKLEHNPVGRGKGRSTEVAANITGSSASQLYKEKKLYQIITKNPEFKYLIPKIDNGEISIHSALTLVQNGNSAEMKYELAYFEAWKRSMQKLLQHLIRQFNALIESKEVYHFGSDDPLTEFLLILAIENRHTLELLAYTKPELIIDENGRRSYLKWINTVEETDKYQKIWGAIKDSPDMKFDIKTHYGSDQDGIEIEAFVNVLDRIGDLSLADKIFEVYTRKYGIDKIKRDRLPREYETISKDQLNKKWSDMLRKREIMIRRHADIYSWYKVLEIYETDTHPTHTYFMEKYKIGGTESILENIHTD